MNKTLLSIIGIIVIIGSMYAYNQYSLYDLQKKHEVEINIIESKNKAIVEDIKNEIFKLQKVQEDRDRNNLEFIEKEKELLNDIKNLEEQIMNDDNKPEIIEGVINHSMNKFMSEVYEETNSNIIK